MKTVADPTTPLTAKMSVTQEDLSMLSSFCSPTAEAISFYLCYPEVPNIAHRGEAITTKDVIHQVVGGFAPGTTSAGSTKDLEEILEATQEAQLKANRLRVIFACRGQRVWQEFDLPVARSQRSLHLDRRFQLAPLMVAIQSMARYCVLLLESGRARIFIVRGTEIQEISGTIRAADLSLQAQDSRVGWSSHIDRNQMEHEKAYFKEVFCRSNELLAEHHLKRVVIGCREDLWGEI